MNKNLNEAIFEMGKADALMYAIENLYLEYDILPEERELYDRGVFVFYAVWDILKKVQQNLESLSAECQIIDVLQAVRELK